MNEFFQPAPSFPTSAVRVQDVGGDVQVKVLQVLMLLILFFLDLRTYMLFHISSVVSRNA